jgi:hypothetical protein
MHKITLAMQNISIMHAIYNYIMGEYTQEIYVLYDYEDECDDCIWIVFISGMTTTFIFYMMTLVHLM